MRVLTFGLVEALAVWLALECLGWLALPGVRRFLLESSVFFLFMPSSQA